MIHTPTVGVLEAHPAAPSSGWNLEPDLADGRGNSFPLSVSQLFSHLHMLSNSEILFFATFSFKNRKQQPVSTSKRYPFQRIGRDTPASARFCSFHCSADGDTREPPQLQQVAYTQLHITTCSCHPCGPEVSAEQASIWPHEREEE